MHKVMPIMMLGLLVSSIVAATTAGLLRNAYAEDNNWYVGEGAKPNMYVTYQIQDFDTNNGRPFTMTIYFEKQDDRGDWIATAYAVDQGQVFNGTLNLSSIDMSVLGKGSQIPKEMNPYVGGYKDSLQWLSAFVPKPGQSLSAASWGKTASIGGSEVKPSGTEKVTVKGGTFDTTKIVYHKSVDNTIWVANEFPFPVKALTYADITTGNPPVQFKFELLATGTGSPPPPSSVTEIPKPPLEQTTATGAYFIDLNWTPAEIKPGADTTFDVSFFDNVHKPVQSVGYDFKVTDSKGNIISDLKNQYAQDNTGHHKVTFKPENSGPMTVSVNINAVGSRDQGSVIQSADFNIVVTPEFPLALVAVLAAIVMAIPLVARHTSMKGIFSGGNN
jgi:hypothetical protein